MRGDGNDGLRGYHVVGTAGAVNDRDDFIQGNGGNDTIYGDLGQDDLLGGTGRTTSDNDIQTAADDATAVDDRLDGNDTVYGGNGIGTISAGDYDTIVGDNAILDRPVDPNGAWIYVQWDQWNRLGSAIGASRMRLVQLLDVPVLGAPPGAGTSGDDNLSGGWNDDVLYGQTGNDTLHGNGEMTPQQTAQFYGDNDVIYGGLGDDDMYGDFGSDIIYGQGGVDHITGGGGRDVVRGGATDTMGTCTFGDRADPENDTPNFNANDARSTRETKGRNEGTKGKTPIKQKNPICLQLVAIRTNVASVSLNVGGSSLLTATGVLDNGSTVDLTTKVVWNTTNSSVARISSAGRITAIAAGNTTVTAALRGIFIVPVNVAVLP